MRKRVISIALTALLVVSITMVPMFSFAANDDAKEAADMLYSLGLFQGTGINSDGTPRFELDRAPTRNEAVTMLVRLLGKENEAQSENWEMPFIDVADWAKPYVGYAFANGLTNGTSANTYSGEQLVTASQYLTFVLRALDYNSNSDFEWDKAWELTDRLGITDGQYSASSGFSRGDVAIVSYNSLYAKTKGSNQTLLESIGGITQKKYVTLNQSYYGGKPYYKLNGKTYSGDYARELVLYEYNGVQYAAFNPTLYIEGIDDVRVEGALIIILALAKNLYDVEKDGNPFTDGNIQYDLRPYQSIGMTIKESRTYTSIKDYNISYLYKLRNKSLSTPDFEDPEKTIEGVRFVKNSDDKYFVCVDDFLSYFGIKKSVSVQLGDGVTYLVIK